MAFASAFKRRLVPLESGVGSPTYLDEGDPQDPRVIQQDDPLAAFKARIASQPQQEPQSQNPFAGPSVRQPQQPQPTMADRYMATAQPVDDPQSVNAMRPRTVDPYDEFKSRLTGSASRPRVADNTSFDAEKLRDLENEKLSTRDKIGMVVQGVARTLGTEPLPTRRQMRIGNAQNQLGRDIKIDQVKSQRDLNALVPVTDPSTGEVVGYAPRRTAAGTQVRANQQDANLSERRRMNSAHIDRWGSMDERDAAQDAQKLYNSGAADDNDALKDEIARRMRLPLGMKLPNHDKGQVQTDASGNFIIVSPKSGVVTDTARPGENKPVGAFSQTQLEEKKREFKITTDQRSELARLGRDAAKERALIMAGAAAGRMGDPVALNTIADGLEQDAKDSDESGTATGRRNAGSLRQKAADIRKEAAKASGAQSALSTAAPKRFTTLQEAVDGFKSSPKNTTHRDPTPDEIEKLKARYGLK